MWDVNYTMHELSFTIEHYIGFVFKIKPGNVKLLFTSELKDHLVPSPFHLCDSRHFIISFLRFFLNPALLEKCVDIWYNYAFISKQQQSIGLSIKGKHRS